MGTPLTSGVQADPCVAGDVNWATGRQAVPNEVMPYLEELLELG